MQRVLRDRRNLLVQVDRRLSARHPGYILSQRAQRLDEIGQRLITALGHKMDIEKLRFVGQLARLRAKAPRTAIDQRRQHLNELGLQLHTVIRKRIAALNNRLAVLAARLQTMSPLATLERGYALVTDAQSGAVLTDASQLDVGHEIVGRLARGSFSAEVKKIDDP